MANINVVNKRTFGSNLVKIVGLSVLGLALWKGVPSVCSVYNRHNSIIKSRENIETAIKNKDLELASRLLKANRRNNFFTHDEVIRYESEIKNKRRSASDRRVLADFDGIVRSSDLSHIRTYVENFKSDHDPNSRVVRTLEERLDGLSEDNFMRRLSNDGLTFAQRIDVSNDYLRLYSQGKYKKIIVGIMLNESYHSLYGVVNGRVAFSDVFDKMLIFHNLLERFKNEDINLDISYDDLVGRVNGYIRDGYYGNAPTNNRIASGTKVRTLYVPTKMTRYRDDFVAGRNSSFPIGSIGTVVGPTGEDMLCVRFEQGNYGGDYEDCKDYWSGSERKVISYDFRELSILTNISDTNRRLMLAELDLIRSGLASYAGH